MGDLAGTLNDDYHYNLFLIRIAMSHLTSLTDRTNVYKWTTKLGKCNRSIDELRLRNGFMYMLVLNVQNGELRPPFDSSPPPGRLLTLASLLPGGTENMYNGRGVPTLIRELEKSGSGKPIIYKNSPDGGAFLAAQPVPRCGAFCYIAVVSKNEK